MGCQCSQALQGFVFLPGRCCETHASLVTTAVTAHPGGAIEAGEALNG